MPATEKTWYDQKLLHLIFGCTSLLMLVSVIWMIAQDHEREWKNHQREFRTIQQKQLRGQLAAEQKLHAEVVEQAEMQLANAESQLPDAAIIQEFKEVSEGVGDFDFSNVDEALDELKVQATTAEKAFEAFNAAQVRLRETRSKVVNATDQATKQSAAAELQAIQGEVTDLKEKLADAQADAKRLRNRVLRPLEKVEARAKYEMDSATGTKKLATANFGAKTAAQGLLYGKELFAEADAMQEEIDSVYRTELMEATEEAERTTANRNKLRSLLTQLTSNVAAAQKNLVQARAEQDRLAGAIEELNVNYFSLTTALGKRLLELPIVDGFNGPLKIDNLWTDGLTMPNGSFGEVRRFDRCTTCHKGIDKTAPGSAVEPAYEAAHLVTLQLATPSTPPQDGATLEDVYGITLAEEGLVDRDDVTIQFVAANSLAALSVNTSDSACASGLMESDVFVSIGGDRVDSPREAVDFLMSPKDGWGSTVEVVVRRGLPQPYTSHPRLDLYVGSLSPHKMSEIGCTVCHEGQGSGTSFNYASHTPNSLEQEEEWWKEYGWFSNHHWIYPMHPARFAESACLKCHHHVVELDASDRYPETPAPKLLAGHNLIQAYGCYGCHEINGYKSPTERVGPDLRLEPNYFAAAAQLSHDASFQQLPEETQQLAHHIVQHPYDDAARHDLLADMKADATSDEPVLTASAQKLAEVLGDIETPGTLRKTGPSLRHVGSKLSPEFLYDWIREPKHFRPSTKMPQFFGMWDHIQDDKPALEQAQRYEPIEIAGIVTYLLDRSQPMLGEVAPSTGVDAPSIERGQVAFEVRGCIACHQHDDFADAEHGEIAAADRPGVSRQIQGPDLSNLGDKFSLENTPDAQKWLYTWLRNPQLYHPRTKMPDLYLTKTTLADGTEVDPAADIAAYLLASSNGWKPAATPLAPAMEDVEAMALEYLRKAFFKTDAEKYVKEGIPAEIAATLKGNEVELANVDGSSGDMKKKLLNYVGAKTISKYGCYGCHDVPGFEAAKPIGVALADWGRKDPSKIAFEHIAEYISHGHHGGGHSSGEEHRETGADHANVEHSDTHGEEEIDEHFYTHRLEHHDRTGFIWQKLKEPRSYDYKKVLNKDYNEKLRMPMFPFTDVQREQVITFVLGLVAEPPAEQFVYQPDAREHALVEGKKVLDKYNCAGCHILETEKWDIEYRPGEFDAPFADTTAFPFTNPTLPANTIAESETPDRQRGSLTAMLSGVPTITHAGRSDDDASPVLLQYDEEEEEWFPVEEGEEFDVNRIKRSITLWEPAAIEGHTMGVGQELEVAASAIKNRYLSHGGDLTFKLLPRVLELERESNPAAKGGEAWGWLPPSLHAEGQKVQPEWLHRFLLDPHPIRPAAFMRMPKFNMSPDEATALVNYFAARDNAAYPYEYTERTSPSLLEAKEEEYVEAAGISDGNGIERMHAAMNVVTYKDYCVSCHLIGNYNPTGSERAKAPNLSDVYSRLRGDYVREWVAKPTSILPYTPMPVVIPYAGGTPVPQTLYHGTPTEQLDGVVDLLMNFDHYTSGLSNIKGMVKTDQQTAAKPD